LDAIQRTFVKSRSATSPHFSYALDYHVGFDGELLANSQYNGNIAQQHWGHGASMDSKFIYVYDKLNRLKSGVSTGTVMSEHLSHDDRGNLAETAWG